MCMSFACVYICALHADTVPAEVRNVNQIPGIRVADRCKGPCAVLVTDPGSSGRASRLKSLQPYLFYVSTRPSPSL